MVNSEVELQGYILKARNVARTRFPNQPIRVWFVKLAEKCWRAYVIDVDTKIKLAKSPLRISPKNALTSLNSSMGVRIVKRTIQSKK